jgi:7-cyano-7-deazaguanine synthase
MEKALVLSSGGIDSTTCLAVAIERLGPDNVSSLSIFYGQKQRKELDCAHKIADYYGIRHYELDLSAVMAYADTPMLAKSQENIPQQSYAEQLAQSPGGIVKTYVPFRNGLFLSAAASLAMSLAKEEETGIYLGAHADDAAGRAYADCTPEFTQAMGQAISLGTYDKISLVSPFINLNKAQIVRLGLELGVPYQYTWSCYEGGDQPCGLCATCLDRQQAFAACGIADPALATE